VPTHLRLDGRALRTLAHPLRARLLSALRTDGAATATGLARRLGTNTGATSYHLRALAGVDLVVEESGRGTGKERWWRAAQDAHGWLEADLQQAGPDARAAASWLRGHYWRQFAEAAAAWELERERWPLAWREQLTTDDALVHVDADELAALQAELHALLHRYHRPGRDGAGTRTVAIHVSALPLHPDRPPA
jgi:predicted ArsR family transcriptional regulator